MDYDAGAPVFQGVEDDFDGGPSYPAWLDFDGDIGPITAPRKSSTPRQSPAIRVLLVRQAEAALEDLTAAEIKAGSTARAEIDNARRFNAVAGVKRDRETVVRICAGQRAGLIRILRVLESYDIFELNDRTRKFVDAILDLSANMAVLSESGWPETRRWLEKALPLIAVDAGAWLEGRFKAHLRAAEAEMSRRIPIRLSDYRTAPSPRDIAERLQLTTLILRQARANKVGLTSIDPESKRDRDRRGSENRRRARGEQAQATRTKTAEMEALAVELGCGLSTLYRHRDDLDAYVAKLRAKRPNPE